MADVTGPISTLPGTVRTPPTGTMCDNHPDRPATHRVQGETDSMGCEMWDECDECFEKGKAEAKLHAAEWATGRCDWCKKDVTDLRDRRDYEEGMCGRVYRVCGPCVVDENARLEEELAYSEPLDYYDDRDYD